MSKTAAELEQLLAALRRISGAQDRHSRLLMRQAGLSLPQYLMLRRLHTAGPGSVGWLARETRLGQATVTAMLDRLARRGLVLRERDPGDRRRTRVCITAAGAALLADMPVLFSAAFESRYRRLSRDERAAILARVGQLAALMDGEGPEPG